MASNLELKIKAIVGGLGELSKLKTALDGAVSSVTGLGKASQNADVSALAKASKDAADSVGSLSDAAGGVGKSLSSLKDSASEGAAALGDWVEAITGVGQAAEGSTGALDDWIESMGGTEESAKDSGDALEAWAEAMGGVGDAADKGDEAVSAWTEAIGDAGAAAKDATDNLLGVGKASKDVSDSLGGLGKSAKDGADGIGAVGESSSTNETKLSKLVTGLKAVVASFFSVSKETSPTVNAFGKAGEAANTMKGKLDEATKGTDGFKKGLGEGIKGLGGFVSSANPAAGAAGTLLTAIKPLAGALAAIAGVKLTFDFLKDAADYAAKVDTLGITLNTVGKNAGYTKGELKTFEGTLKETGISTEAARDSMIQMMNAGLSLGTQAGQTAPQVQLLARAAQDLAVATGENSSESMQRLITNIQQMDTVGFRFMGLSVDITKAQEKFAQSIGTTAGALTDAQKRQGVLNEVLQQSAKLNGVYEESMESVGKKLGSMKRYVDELKLSLGDKLLPIYGAVVDAGTKLLKDLNKQAEGFDKNNVAAKAYGAGVKAVMTPLGGIFSKAFGVLLDLFESLAPHFQSFLEVVGDVVDVANELFGTMVDDGAPAMELLKTVLKGLELPLAGLSDGMKVVKVAIFATVSAMSSFYSNVIGGIAELVSYVPGLGVFSDRLQSIADRFGTVAKSADKKMDEAADALLKGDSATKRWFDSIVEAQGQVDKVNTTPFKDAEEKVRLLTRAQNDNTLSSAQQVEAFDKLSAELLAAKEAGTLTEKEFAKLNAKLGEVDKKIKEELDESLKQLKTTSNELATNVSVDANTIVGALGKIAQNGRATAELFGQAFSQGVNMAKNVEELAQFSTALDKAKERWPQAPQALADAQRVVADRFTEIYTKQLEGLRTTKDWETLRQSVIDLGKAGVLTGDQVKTSLAEGEIAVNKLSPAFKAAAEASKGINTALEANTKQLDLLNKAVAETSTKASEHFGKVGDGYRTLSGLAQSTTDQVVEQIQRREARELSYIDATYKNTDKAERDKTTAVINSIAAQTKALDKNYNEQLRYLGLSEKADKSALEAKLLGLDKEIESVRKAMGETHTSRKDAAEKLKALEKEKVNAIAEFEAQSKAKRIEVMTNVVERYKAFIDRLNAEEDRHLGKVRDSQQQIEQARMSAEERIRAIQKSALSEYDKYQADMADINELKTKAREAANKGEYDKAKEYLSQAKNLIGDVNREVKDGEKVMISKEQAAKNAQKATKDLLDEEINLHSKVGDAAQKKADDVNRSSKEMQGKVDELTGKIKEVQAQAEKETKLNIQFNGEEAINKLSTLKELLDKKDNLLKVDLDLKGAKEQLDDIMLKIAKGEKIPADMDTSKARAALLEVQKQAEKSGDIKLVMDTQKALDAIKAVSTEAQKPQEMKVNADTKDATTALSSLKSEANGTGKWVVSATVDGMGNVKAAVEELKSAAKGDYNAKVVYGAKKDPTWDQVKTEVIKIKDELGNTTYTDVTVKGDYVQKATEILALNTKLGTIKPVDTSVTIKTNSKEAAEAIAKAMEKKPDVTSTHNVKLAGGEKLLPELEQYMKPREATSKHKVETDAAQKIREIDNALAAKTVTSTHNVTTDASAKKAEVDAATTAVSVTSNHSVQSNAAEVKPQIDSALVAATATSTHDIQTNAAGVVPQVDSALKAQSVTSEHQIATNAAEAVAEIEGLDGLQTSSTHDVTTDAEDAVGEVEALDGLDTSSLHEVSTDAADAEGEIQSLDGLDTSSFHDVSTDADAAAGEIQSLDGQDTSSEHTVEANNSVSEAETEIDALDQVQTESTHEVDASKAISETTTELEQQLDGADTKSKHTVDSKVDKAKTDVESLNNLNTTSPHYVDDNADEASGNIQSLNGQNTNSTHTIYVEKVYVNEGGGLAGMFFGRIPVGEVTVGEEKSDPRYAEGGPVGFAVGGPVGFAVGGNVNSADELRKASASRSQNGVDTARRIQEEAKRQVEEARRRREEAERKRLETQRRAEEAARNASNMSSRSSSSSRSYEVGGPVAFAAGGSVRPQRGDGQRKPSYHRMSGGTVPGAGNEDTQHRLLDAGSFVLRKSVVNKYGAQKILSMISAAKTLPKRESQSPGKVQAVLMPGEIVVDRDTTSRIGSGFLSHMNNPAADVSSALKFAEGGFVHNFSPVITAPVDLSTIGQAFANGGPVANPVAAQTVQVDLRSNKGRASVTVEQNQSQNLLSLLADIQGRS